MKPWFARRPDTAVAVDGPDQLDAYKEGRRDEHSRLGRERPAIDKPALNDAYDRGRRDERRRHRGSPGIAFLVLLVAIVGGVIVYLAIREGSFTTAGATVDRSISSTAQKVQAPIRGAEDKAGNALENAGQRLKNTSGGGQN
jgi:hypothetical protein